MPCGVQRRGAAVVEPRNGHFYAAAHREIAASEDGGTDSGISSGNRINVVLISAIQAILSNHHPTNYRWQNALKVCILP